MTNAPTETPNELSFEDALAKLGKIVEAMENEKISLDDMMKNFEEGKKLSDFCARKLDSLERKIELLVKEDENGGQWRPFDEGPEDEDNDDEKRG